MNTLKQIGLTAPITLSIVMSLFCIGQLANAKADPDTVEPGSYYWGQDVCNTWTTGDGTVSIDKIQYLGRYLMSKGYTSHQASGIVWYGTKIYCPEYTMALWSVAKNGDTGSDTPATHATV